jgi:hypothetical protein
MRVPRKQVSAALYTLLQGAYAWGLANPRLKLPQQVPANQQPALFLVKPKENISQNPARFLPTYNLQYYALVIVRSDALPSDVLAESLMDDILDSIEGALMPNPGEPQTLGGLVNNCWIEGDITIDTPVLFPQCAIWVPITVKVGV